MFNSCTYSTSPSWDLPKPNLCQRHILRLLVLKKKSCLKIWTWRTLAIMYILKLPAFKFPNIYIYISKSFPTSWQGSCCLLSWFSVCGQQTQEQEYSWAVHISQECSELYNTPGLPKQHQWTSQHAAVVSKDKPTIPVSGGMYSAWNGVSSIFHHSHSTDAICAVGYSLKTN